MHFLNNSRARSSSLNQNSLLSQEASEVPPNDATTFSDDAATYKQRERRGYEKLI